MLSMSTDGEKSDCRKQDVEGVHVDGETSGSKQMCMNIGLVDGDECGSGKSLVSPFLPAEVVNMQGLFLPVELVNPTNAGRKLSESWGLMRECVAFIKENSEGWKRRSAEETKRIKEEEKTRRLEMIAEKRKKLGNKKLKNLTGIETRELKRTTSLRLEVAEIKHMDSLQGWKQDGEASYT
jgi:hypothetical protein